MKHITSDIVYGFSAAYLVSRYDNPKPIPRAHEEFWDYVCDPHPWVAIGAPRGHAKTTAITLAYALANICFRKRKHVLIVSDTEGQASQFLNNIRTELTENEELIDTFKIRRLTRDSATVIVGEFEDGQQFRVFVKGAEQAMRGCLWRHTRPDLIICDDLENDEMVESQERRKKFRGWFYNALLPIGSDDCIVRVIGTVLHFDSLLARILPMEEDEGVETAPLKITWKPAVQAKKAWYGVTFRAHPSIDDFSSILWEDKFPIERLSRIRLGYLEAGNAEGYSQEYLNNPLDSEHSYFRPEWIKGFDADDRHLPRMEYYAGVDMAISKEDLAAYSVIAVVGVDPSGIIRTAEIVRFRGDSIDIVEEMASVQRSYNVEFWVVEEENIAKAVGPYLYLQMQKGEIPYMNIHTMSPNKDKLRRARPLQARMRAGSWLFDKEASWFHTLQQELLQFPKGRYSDQVDALAWIGQMLDSMYDAKSDDAVEEDEYEQEYEETLLWEDNTPYINRYTGY